MKAGPRRGAQLALNVGLRAGRSFANYVVGPNELALSALQAHVGDAPERLYLWGAQGTGKTHLLEAACAAAGDRSIYLPMARLREEDPALFAGLAALQVVCVDDVDAVAAGMEASFADAGVA